ncbi:unnamed protein product [Pleuronectes platessa]|uniref:Uncharacterized protein n=1 Tax=Pleuronectes platessa TaxID=8262 RepID=A0A9N7TXD8_PLEPL|nr:unnamed protein product [Pleuronectes platessa]
MKQSAAGKEIPLRKPRRERHGPWWIDVPLAEDELKLDDRPRAVSMHCMYTCARTVRPRSVFYLPARDSGGLRLWEDSQARPQNNNEEGGHRNHHAESVGVLRMCRTKRDKSAQ